jgi:hypothetical protein
MTCTLESEATGGIKAFFGLVASLSTPPFPTRSGTPDHPHRSLSNCIVLLSSWYPSAWTRRRLGRRRALQSWRRRLEIEWIDVAEAADEAAGGASSSAASPVKADSISFVVVAADPGKKKEVAEVAEAAGSNTPGSDAPDSDALVEDALVEAAPVDDAPVEDPANQEMQLATYEVRLLVSFL